MILNMFAVKSKGLDESKDLGEPVTKHEQCPGGCFNIKPFDAESHRQASNSSLLHQADEFTDFAIAAKQPSVYENIFSWQTRVIRIYPSPDENEPLTADLVTVDLIVNEGVVIVGTKENVTFDALSYCWGNGPRERLLILNQTQFAISSTLHAALRKCRSRPQVRYLWVDAICINQEDDDEKATQVAMMLNIYQMAAKVHLWLGEQSEDSDLAITSLDNHRSFLDQLEATAKMKHGDDCIGRLRKIYSALFNFFARPWFRRTWIRQEAYAARQIETHCGDRDIPLDSLLSGSHILRKIEAFSADVEWSQDTNIQLLLLDDLAKSTRHPATRQRKEFRPVLEVLVSSRNYQVSDPRDIIYAALGKSR